MKAILYGAAQIGIALLVCIPGATAATPFSDAKMKSLMSSIGARADTFENKLERALDNSSANGSALEDVMNRIAAVMEDAVDDMAENFNEKDSTKFIDKLENAPARNFSMLHPARSDYPLCKVSGAVRGQELCAFLPDVAPARVLSRRCVP